MRALIVLALAAGCPPLIAACEAPEPAEVVIVPPTVALAALTPIDDTQLEAIYDLGNPNGFPIRVDALWLGLTADGASDAACVELAAGGCAGEAPDWPDDATLIADAQAPAAMTIAARETTECHAALEGCQVIGAEFCCDNGDGCKPLGDCFGRVTPEGSRCLVCPTHVELRLRFDLAGFDAIAPPPLTARAGAHFDAEPMGPTLSLAPERQIDLAP